MKNIDIQTLYKLLFADYQHTYKVPKEWLLEFLTSEDYNSITRKSKEHYEMISKISALVFRGNKKQRWIRFTQSQRCFYFRYAEYRRSCSRRSCATRSSTGRG